MADMDALLRRLERVSEDIREREIALANLQREREALRAAIRNGAAQPFALDVARALLVPRRGIPTRAEQDAVDLIRRDGGTATRGWLASQLDISLDAANTRLTRAHAKGLLERVGK